MKWLIFSRIWDEGAIALLWLLSFYLKHRLEQTQGDRQERIRDVLDLVKEAIDRLEKVRN